MYYVYVIKSKHFDWKYIGYSANLRQRLEEHQKGYVQATKAYRPLELIFYEAYKNNKDAKRREKYFKTNPGKRTLKLILQDSIKSQYRDVI